MKQPKAWFDECLKVADEFCVFVITAPETVTTVQVDKDVAATLVEKGAEYGYLHGTTLIIGASPTDMEMLHKNQTPTTGLDTSSMSKDDKVHEVMCVPIPYSDVEVALQNYLDDGWKLETSYQTHENLVFVFSRLKQT